MRLWLIKCESWTLPAGHITIVMNLLQKKTGHQVIVIKACIFTADRLIISQEIIYQPTTFTTVRVQDTMSEYKSKSILRYLRIRIRESEDQNPSI
jgi:hypothetical protein